MFNNLKIILLRIKVSSVSELLYRLKEFFFVRKLKKLIAGIKPLFTIPDIKINIEKLIIPDFTCSLTENDADAILNGHKHTLNLEQNEIDDFENRTKSIFFSDIRITNDIDIRCVWEAGRLQHLTELILFSKKKSIQSFVKKEILHWINENPFLKGPHYISVMECGLRITAFAISLKYLDNLTDNDSDKILSTIYEHAWVIEKRLSLYSSLGNHTICEAVGLIFAGVIFKKRAGGRKWLQKGIKLLNREAYRQILNDGGPAEQSFNYHSFVLDLYQLTIDFLEKNNFTDIAQLKKRVQLGYNFLNYFNNLTECTPNIGDSDNGYAIAPRVAQTKKNIKKSDKIFKTFSDSGYTIIKNNKCFFCFNHGSLGMAPLYNHGHADALSIILSVYGKLFLIDPGTYQYNCAPKWRRYFKSTRAHNTVCIDDFDQAVQETGFIWSKPYSSELIEKLEKNNGMFITASHDGYKRLKDPITHCRKIHYDGALNFQITDSFEGSGSHEFELNYHFHPDVSLTKNGDGWIAVNDDVEMKIALLDKMDFTLHKGETTPVFGWFSKAYGEKQACSVLSCKVKTRDEKMIFKTEFLVS